MKQLISGIKSLSRVLNNIFGIFSKYFKGLVLLSFFVSSCISRVEDKKSPNFVFVLVDDQGWQHTSVEMMKGKPQTRSDYHYTPNLKKLAQQGIRFSSGYAPAGVCAPSRYSIQYGQTPARLRMTKVGVSTEHIDHTMLSIPKMLKSVNPHYKAAHFGKFHLDVDPSVLGYDLSDGPTRNVDGGFNTVPIAMRYGENVDKDPKKIFSISERAVSFMEQQVEKGNPFYLQISHYATHSDVYSLQETLGKYKKMKKGALHNAAGFAAMTEDLDTGLGIVLDKIEELGIEDNTYIFYMADNGGVPAIPFHKYYENSYNFPLFRGKWDIMEGGVRVPFIVKGPGIRPGSQCDVPVIGYDLLPTIADLSGYTEPLPENIDGGSIKKLLLEDHTDSVERPFGGLVFHSPHTHGRVLDQYPSAIRIGDYKLVIFRKKTKDRRMLFDLTKDIGESENLVDILPELADEMERKLDEYLIGANADIPFR